MWNSVGIWVLRVRTERVRLWVPVPLYVLTDLLESVADLCEIILPRFGVPNVPASLCLLVRSLSGMYEDEPLFRIHVENVQIECKRLLLGGA